MEDPPATTHTAIIPRKPQRPYKSISASTSFDNFGGFENSEIPKNNVKEMSNAIDPPCIPCGISMFKSSIARFTARLETIATFAASAEARFQLNPIAIVGTSAAAKVPHPNVPNNATNS